MGDVKDKGNKSRRAEEALHGSRLKNIRLGRLPFVIIAVTTLATIAISIYCLSSDYFIIFQNLFYIPIIIACVYYTKRGFAFSVIIACIYFFLTLVFTRDSSTLLQAFIRVLIFVLVAGIITYLSSVRKRVEEVLRESGERFRQLIEMLPEAVCEIDTLGKVVFANNVATIMVGYDQSDIAKGVNMFSMIAPEDQERAANNIRRMMEGEALGSDEYTLVRKDGSKFPAFVHISNILDKRGKTIGFRGIVVDITERKQLEEAQQHLAAIVESSHDAIIGKTLEGIITSWNKGAEERYGYSAAEVIGHSISIIVPPDRAGEVPRFLEKIRRGQAVIDYEAERITKDGRRVTVLLTVSPIKDASGKIVGASTIAQDITVIKKAEERAKQAAAEWQTTFDSIADLVSIQDRDFKLVRVNKAYADAVGMKMEDIIGRPCYEVVHNTSSYIENCPHHRTLETKKAVTQEVFEPRLNAYLEVSTSPIFDKDGELLGSVHIAKNITERKKAEEKLARLSLQNELILSSAAEGILGLDLQGNHTFVNSAAAGMIGYEVEELIGRPSHSTWHHTKPDGSPYPQEECGIHIAYREGVVHRSSAEVFWRKDGTSFPVEYASTPINEQGRTVGVVVTFTDITERKKAEVALRERLKELSCLYGISAVLEVPGISLDEILQRVAMLIPQAWQFPDITETCIVLKGQTFQTARFCETSWMQASEIIVNGKPVGQIRVCYLEERQASDEGPFMVDERHLLDAIAERLGRVIERVWAEEALQQSEERYHSLYVDSRDAVMILSLDQGFLAGNPAAIEIFGCRDEQDFTTRTPASLSPEYQPDGARSVDKAQDMMRLAMEEGSHSFEWMHRRADGVDFLATVLLSRLGSGGKRLLQATVRDITESNRLEEMLKESEQKFRELADLLPQTVCEIDLQGRFTYANKYGLEAHGYTWDEIEKSLNALDLFIPEQRDSAAQNISRVLSGQKFDDHEYSVLRKDGSTYPAIIYTNAIVRNGQVVGIRALVVDITERKKIEQMKTDFVSFISHQLRTPVAGLISYIDNMLEGITGELNGKQVEYLTEMRDVCARNNRLIADLLNVSRLERGVLAVNINSVDLRSVVDVAVKEYSKSIEEKGLSLNIKEADQGIVVLADTDKLAEVLKNVIHNATKFTSKGSISIEIVAEGQHGIVKVSDTGMGISKMGLQNLFKKERVFGGAVTVGGGAGLGLYIAKGFMKLQDGDIMVESVMGKGSTFIISLPKK